MTKTIFKKSKYKETKKGDPLTSTWTLRTLRVVGENREVLVRKINKKKQIRKIEDRRYSTQISFTKAKKIHRNRSKRARTMDDKTTSKKTKHFADTSWKKRPNRYDVSGIDTKKK